MFVKMSLEDIKNINLRPRFPFVLSVEKYEALHESGPYLIYNCVLLCYLSSVSSTLVFQPHERHKLSLAWWSSPIFAWLFNFHPSVSTLMPPPQKSLSWCCHLFCYCSHISPRSIIVFGFSFLLPEHKVYYIFPSLLVNGPVAIRAGVTSVLSTTIWPEN